MGGPWWIAAFDDAGFENIGSAQHQVRTELDTQTFMIDRAQIDTAVLKRQAGGSNTQLDFAAHRLDVLPLLLQVNLSRRLVRKLADFSTNGIR